MSQPCPTRAELDSFQAGDLDEAALTAVASHVESCPNCQRSLETIIGDSADTVLAALLEESRPSPFAAEPACRVAIERVSALAGSATSDAEGAPTTIVLAGASTIAKDEALPLETIREYKLLTKLGEGGMGAVYKALHMRLDKVVALKVLPEGRMRDGGSVARFQREMKAVGRLDHPNIVRAMDAGDEDGTHFLVMEYVEGADLSQLARNIGPLPVADACELVRQAALGLQEAHEHGMVHRDIKPSNLILAQSPRKKSPPTLKILDLGLALLSEALSPDHQGLTSTGQMMGTIDYMAPEQGSDTHGVDIRADIYSLGATLYRLLTGAAPFAGEKFDTPVKKILALATKEPPAIQSCRSDIPPRLAAIIHKMLAKDPADRFATPEELAETLAPFCQSANLSALLERGAPDGQPATKSEAPTHEQISSPSADTAPRIDPARRPSQGKPKRGVFPRWPLVAAAVGGGALLLVLGVVFYLETLKGTIRIEINDDTIKVVLDDKGATFQGADKKHQIKVQSGEHGLTVTCGELKFYTDKFELRKGETLRLSVKLLLGKVEVVDVDKRKSLGQGDLPQLAKSGWHGWPKDAPAPAIAPFDAKQARKHQQEWANYLGVPVEYKNSIDMKFVLIPPGEFMMGSTAAEIEAAIVVAGENKYWRECIRSEAPQHKVILTQAVYLGVNEVTQAEYEKVIGQNPSYFAAAGPGKDAGIGHDTETHPVETVSWNDAAEFCSKLSDTEKLKPFYLRSGETVTRLEGTGYRLPTEAQWEFACRAGTTAKYWIGEPEEQLVQSAWFGANSGRRTHASAALKANPLGLYDIHGNVWEWVQDWWEPNYYRQFQEKPALNPSGPASTGSRRVIRGGDWFYPASRCSAAYRDAFDPPSRAPYVGFRVSLPVDAVKAAIAERNTKPAIASTGWQGWPKDAPAPAIAPFDAKQARKHQEEWANYLGVPLEHKNTIDMTFVLIPPGEFIMGSTPEEIETALAFITPTDKQSQKCVKTEGPRHKVILTRPIYLGVVEVTQAQYEKVMGKNPSSFAATGPGKDSVIGIDTTSYPVESVNWNDAAEFCTKLCQLEELKPLHSRVGERPAPLGGDGYRLPTEAEWEFACRAGTTTRYWNGDGEKDLLLTGWFGTNAGRKTHPVGELRANPFGLYDMHGNVWEWVQDGWDPAWYGKFQKEPAIDPSSPYPAGGSLPVLRGGAASRHASHCRASNRYADVPEVHFGIGFRVVLTVDAVRDQARQLVPAKAPFDAATAGQHQKEWAKSLGVPVEYQEQPRHEVRSDSAGRVYDGKQSGGNRRRFEDS
ncbi:MAG: SUMF1/EgtB/PvdO family nonheme iron enzyme [Pirellulaceae bacterium]